MKLVLFAGGFGTRIGDENVNMPKPLIEIGGMPILWHIMKHYLHYGHKEIIIACGYKAQMVKQFFVDYALYLKDLTINCKDNHITMSNNLAEDWSVTLIDTGLRTCTGTRPQMLKELDAEVCAYSRPPDNTRGNLYLEACIDELVESHLGGLSELQRMQEIMNAFQPDIILHIAAQAIVLTSYENPVSSFAANAQGTVHILECARHCHSCKAVICITTDKCYENKECHYPYREGDELGGKAPYSASKAMAEIAISAYRRSFLAPLGIACCSARAGNVIGGGDYATWRIMPNIAESLVKGEQMVLRNPLSIRPWQHVMGALYGYLVLTMKAYQQPENYAKAYNFAPFKSADTYTVQAVTELYLQSTGDNRYRVEARPDYKPEATLLQLDPSLALAELGWKAQLEVPEAIALTATRFDSVQRMKEDALSLTQQQIRDFFARI